MMHDAELLLHVGCELAEGPWWDAERQTLFFVDGFGRTIHEYAPAAKSLKTWRMDRHVGAAIPCEDGRILAMLRDGVYYLDPKSGELSRVCLVEPELDNNRLNDAKCDATGRLWFGTMSMTANQPEREFEVAGSLYKLDNGAPVRMLDNVGISNGMAWTSDGGTMYYIDSPTGKVFAFDFDAGAGAISNRRVAAAIDSSDGVPDGMTIDADDKIWVAHFGGAKVSRWDPESGRQLDVVRLPTANVTSCCFGGPDLDILYITTAKKELTPEQLASEPLAGGIFCCRPGVAGLPLRRFGN